MSGFDAGSFLMGVTVVVLVILVLDLVLAGGAMSMGTMGAMMGTPWGWLALVVLIAVVAVLTAR